MDIAAGNEDLTVEQLEARLDAEPYEGAEVNPLTGVIEERNDDIAALEDRIAELDDALERAQRDLTGQTQITQRLREEHEQAISSLQSELSAYRSDVENYRGDVTQTIAQNNERVDDIQRTASEQEAALQETIASLESRVFILEGQLAECQGQNQARLRPRDEYALVDGQVIGVNAGDDTATLSVGRRDRVTLGLTFEVYDDGGAIRPDDEGEYPRGKGAVEIIRIDEASSVARIIRENPRNPIVAGDVFANALYDPDKEYSFVVFGNFDMNGDGDATAQERNDVEALIRDWGGRLEDDLSGRTDFLVLGDRPKLPIQPAQDAPLPVIQAFINKQAEVERYDALFERATQASIPVLNQNRLMTLTGLRGQR
jgi:TolA-binding protein